MCWCCLAKVPDLCALVFSNVDISIHKKFETGELSRHLRRKANGKKIKRRKNAKNETNLHIRSHLGATRKT